MNFSSKMLNQERRNSTITIRGVFCLKNNFTLIQEMREQTQQFATALLDHARTSYELEVMLNYNPTGENWDPGERQTLDRLKLAIKYKQKQVCDDTFYIFTHIFVKYKKLMIIMIIVTVIRKCSTSLNLILTNSFVKKI